MTIRQRIIAWLGLEIWQHSISTTYLKVENTESTIYEIAENCLARTVDITKTIESPGKYGRTETDTWTVQVEDFRRIDLKGFRRRRVESKIYTWRKTEEWKEV